MLTKAEAMRRAAKLPGPKPGVVMTIRPVEVALAWLELHGLTVVKPRWDMGVLVVTPPPTTHFMGTSPPHRKRTDGEGRVS